MSRLLQVFGALFQAALLRLLSRPAILCLALAALGACDGAEDGPPTVIEGTALYQGQPLANVMMGIRGTNGSVVRPLLDEDSTDSNGRFRLEEFLETGGILELTGWDPRLTTGEPVRFYYYFPNTAERYYARGRHHRITVEFELADREAGG